MKKLLWMAILLSGTCFAQHPDSLWIPQTTLPANANYRFEDMFFFGDNSGYGISYYGELRKFSDDNAQLITINDTSGFRLNGTRCISFLNKKKGFIGALNNKHPFWKTVDSGYTWTPIQLPHPVPSGICGLSMVSENVLYGCGAFDIGYLSAPTGAVPVLIKTTDGGDTFTTIDMSPYAKSLVDCKFFTPDFGFVTGTVDSTNFRNGHAVVLMTTNGGNSWSTVYKSKRIGEQGWKIFFRNDKDGYVALQSAVSSGDKYIIKTTNGGNTWSEVYLGFVHLRGFPQGVCFADEMNGIAGGYGDTVFTTSNGGTTWLFSKSKNINHMNRSRKINDTTYYIIASQVLKFSKGKVTSVEDGQSIQSAFPIPADEYINIPLPFEGLCSVVITNEEGKVVDEVSADNYYKMNTINLSSGVYSALIQSRFGVVTKRFVVHR